MTYRKLQELYGDSVWPGVIPTDTNFRNASVAQKVPSDYVASSRGVIAYRNLLKYLVNLTVVSK